MRYLFTLTCLLLATAAVADEPEFDFKSNKAKAAVQKYQDASRKSNKRNLDSLIRSLEAAFKHERTDGDFEEAIKIRDAVKSLKKGDGLPSDSTVPKRAKVRIPRDAVKYEGHHYKIYAEGVPHSVAQKRCERAGGHLVRIESEDENRFLASLSRRLANVKGFWIDGSDENKEGQWRFSNGELIRFSHWNTGEPSNGHGHEHYIEIITVNSLWNDIPGGVRDRGFICEWDE